MPRSMSLPCGRWHLNRSRPALLRGPLNNPQGPREPGAAGRSGILRRVGWQHEGAWACRHRHRRWHYDRRTVQRGRNPRGAVCRHARPGRIHPPWRVNLVRVACRCRFSSLMWPSQNPPQMSLARCSCDFAGCSAFGHQDWHPLRSAGPDRRSQRQLPRSDGLRCQPSCPARANLGAHTCRNHQITGIRNAELGAQPQFVRK